MTELLVTDVAPFPDLMELAPPPQVERRHAPRLPAPPVEVVNLSASVVNIGLGGICLQLPSPEEFVEERQLALRDRITGEEQSLSVKVVWIGPDRAGLLWHSLDARCSRWLQEGMVRWATTTTHTL